MTAAPEKEADIRKDSCPDAWQKKGKRKGSHPGYFNSAEMPDFPSQSMNLTSDESESSDSSVIPLSQNSKKISFEIEKDTNEVDIDFDELIPGTIDPGTQSTGTKKLSANYDLEDYQCQVASVRNSNNRCWGLAALTAFSHLDVIPKINLDTIQPEDELDENRLSCLKALNHLTNGHAESRLSCYEAVDCYSDRRNWLKGTNQDPAEFCAFILELIAWATDAAPSDFCVRCTFCSVTSCHDIPDLIVTKSLKKDLLEDILRETVLVRQCCCGKSLDTARPEKFVASPELLCVQFSGGRRPKDLKGPTVFGVSYFLTSVLIHEGSKFSGHYICAVYHPDGDFHFHDDSRCFKRELKASDYIHIAIYEKKRKDTEFQSFSGSCGRNIAAMSVIICLPSTEAPESFWLFRTKREVIPESESFEGWWLEPNGNNIFHRRQKPIIIPCSYGMIFNGSRMVLDPIKDFKSIRGDTYGLKLSDECLSFLNNICATQ